GTVHIEARATADGDDLQLSLARLAVHARQPLVAEILAHGDARLTDGALGARDLSVRMTADGHELRKLAPTVLLRGGWTATARADGPGDRLRVRVELRPPAGRVDVDGQLAARAGALTWEATAVASAIDPARAVEGGPPGELALRARGRGRAGTA